MKKKRLGDVLRERGQISHADLARAIEAQQGKLIHLGELLLERGLVQKPDLIAALAEVTRIPYVDCKTADVRPDALRILPRGVAERCCALPLTISGTQMVVAMAEPQNLQAIDELRFTSGMSISPRLGFRSEIKVAIAKWYAGTQDQQAAGLTEDDDPGNTMEFVSTSSRQRNVEAMQEMQAELLHKRTPAVRLVSNMIAAAMTKQASDIHIEPQAADTVVRFRVDGMLRDFERVPRHLQNSLASRIKILSDMDIAERRTPQDGRFLVKLASRTVDLRISTLPTQYGEKVVMRLLEPDAPLRGFEELGLAPEIASSVLRVLSLPQGMFLTTGPTGSGKSTTLYTALNLVRKPTVNIITVEDPVEYALAGINQVQVNTKAGLNFASVLRSILRQDPNVIMVGEIRDKETAEIAMKAAQTGHLVLSTLHTNDSIAAVTRLLDLGVPSFLVATSVTTIMAQRLVRKLCRCHHEVTASPEHIQRLTALGMNEPTATQRVAIGCESCDHSGYKGRIGIYEMLDFDESIRTAVRSGGRNDEIRDLARANGMKLMQEYGLELVKQGLTTLEEVLRVVPFEPIQSLPCSGCGRDLMPAFLFCPYCGAKKKTDGHKSARKPEDVRSVREGVLQR
jgi:type IV pilus assembly protein PilB